MDKSNPADPEIQMMVNPAYWMIMSHMRLPNGQKFSFTNHEYQIEWYQTLSKKICYMKATGGGVSECEIWKSNHGLRYGRYPQGVAYWFPTNDDMLDYSKTRFGPIYKLNHDALGKYLKSGGKGLDSAAVKRIGNSNLYLRGARLAPMGEGDTKISTKTSGIHVDRNVLDEVDQFDPDALSKIEGRLGHSEIAETVYIANPSDEDYGIDLIWQQSDQRHWFRKCCNKWSCPELDFPDLSIKYKDGRGYIACKVCGGPLKIYNGEGSSEWVPSKPDAKIIGWRWSHLSSVFHDPADILDKFNNPPQGNLADVYRLDLGLPYSNLEDKLRREDVLACCGPDATSDNHSGPCAMGVDNDMVKHVVIGIRTGNERFEIVKVATCNGFDEVHDLVRKYNVKSTVVDRKPNIDAAMQFQKAEGPIGNKVWLCEYSDTMLAETQWNDNTQIVRVHRTGCFDGSHRLLAKGMVRIPRQSPQIEEFARQCCNVARYKEKDKRTGQEVYRYRTTGKDGADHYRNAFNYFTLAAGNHRIAIAKSRFANNNSEPQFVVNDTERYI